MKLQDCTLDQLCYIMAFNALNNHLLPRPAKPSLSIKALKFLARWKYHIFADLKNSYFQIHVAKLVNIHKSMQIHKPVVPKKI